MKRLILLAILIIAIVTAAARSNADSITFNFDSIISSSGVSSITSLGTLTLTQNGNSIDLAVNLTNPSFKILDLSLNFNDSKFSSASTFSLANQTLTVSENGVKSGSYAGLFDITVPGGGNIGAWGAYTDKLSLNNGNTALTLADLFYKDTLNQLFTSIHIGNYSGGASIWAGATSFSTAVPEPSTVILLAFGLAALGVCERKLGFCYSRPGRS